MAQVSQFIYLCIIMFRRFNKQSCRISLDPDAQTYHQGSNANFPMSSLGILNQGKPTHKKYISTFSSMAQSPLYVRRQQLRQKERQRCFRVAKQPRMKLKQKTEHFNFKYLQWLKMRKHGMRWIQQNMALGVAFLWKKMKDQIVYFQKGKNIKYNQRFQKQVNSMSQQIDCIIQDANGKIPDCQKDDFDKLFRGRQSVQFKYLQTNLAQVQKKINSSSFKSYNKPKQLLKQRKRNKNNQEQGLASTAVATPGKEPSLVNLKQSVCRLNSFFCLFKRKVSLKKQDLLINQFFQRRSNNVSFTPQQLQQFVQIMKINQQRCQLMGEIIKNVGILRSHEPILRMSQQILNKFGQIDVVKELAMTAEQNREEILTAKMKSCNNVIIEIAQPVLSHQNQSQIIHDSNLLCVSSHKGAYNIMPSKVNIVWKEKANNKSQKIMKEQKFKKVQRNQEKLRQKLSLVQRQKDKFIIKKLSLNKSIKFVQIEKQKPKPKKSQKIVFNFAEAQQQNKQKLQNKSIRVKLKSSKSIRSKRQITWEDLQRSQRRDYKSLKSVKSLKSIGSQSELQSSKLLRSLRTQRQMKYLHGHVRHISYISKYRDKLFKLNGLDDEHRNESRDFVDATADNRQENSGDHSSLSIQEMECQPRQSIELETENRSVIQHSEQQQKSVTDKSSQIFLKKIKKKCQQKAKLAEPQFSQKKEKIIKDFIHRFDMIQKENNILKQKFLILNELQKMLDGKIISLQMFQKYRAYFQGQRNSRADDVQCDKVEADSNKLLKPSHYSHLLNFRKLIQNTTELNQINKYYYSIDQFKCQGQQIKKIKQANKREDFFFHIQSSTEQIKRSIYVQFYREEKQRPNSKILFQKGF